jgi:hypothetical protein
MSSNELPSTSGPDTPPSPASAEDATILMVAAANGDRAAADRLLPLVYAQLRSAAEQSLAGERAGHTLTATAIVHEAYIKLSGPRQVPWEGRGHFYAAAAEAMRQVLLDHAKRRLRLKRGGGERRGRGHAHRPVQAAATHRRGRLRLGLHGRAGEAGRQRKVALKIIKLGMDTRQVVASLRAGAAGAGDDGPPQHRAGAGCGGDGDGAAVLRDGTGQGRPHRRVLRQEQPEHRGPAGTVRAGLQRRAARAHQGDHPPRHQAVRTSSCPRRTVGRTRRSSTSASPRPPASKLTEKTLFTEHRQLIGTPEYMSPEQAEGSPRHRHPHRCLLPRRAALRTAHRHHAVHGARGAPLRGVRRDPADHPRGRAAQAQHFALSANTDTSRASRPSAHTEPKNGWARSSGANWTGS